MLERTLKWYKIRETLYNVYWCFIGPTVVAAFSDHDAPVLPSNIIVLPLNVKVKVKALI